MPDTLLTLGDVTFVRDEVPEDLPIGGTHALAVQDFPGGKRTAQSFGSFPKDVAWTGQLRGENAEPRARTLEGLYMTGDVIPLVWSGWRLRGVVVDFTATIKHKFEIDYSIVFKPLLNELQYGPAPPGGAAPSDEQILGQAFAQAKQRILAPPAQFTFADTTKKDVNDLQALLDANLRAAQGRLNAVPNPILIQMANKARTIVGSLIPLVKSTNSGTSYAASDLANLILVTQKVFEKSAEEFYEIKVIEPNLYELASSYYGDPALWHVIANAQSPRLLDPTPTGFYILKIPKKPPKSVATKAVFK